MTKKRKKDIKILRKIGLTRKQSEGQYKREKLVNSDKFYEE